MLGLGIYEDDLCGGCGLPTAIRQDPRNLFRIEHPVCPVCKSLAPAGRAQAEVDRKAKEALGENAPPTAALPGDGRTTVLRRVADAD